MVQTGHFPSLSVSPPMKSVEFHTPKIDRYDGFPEPIREEDALIGQADSQ